MELLRRYEALKAKVIDRKEPFADLMDFVEHDTEFMLAPASVRWHMNYERGLLEHSVNVAETLLKIKAVLAPEISDESCVLVGVLHDLGKAGMPGNPQYLPNEPTPQQKRYGSYIPQYRFNNDLIYLSVPIRSLYLILPYMDLSEEEVQAIAYHDGQYVEDNRSAANHETPLALLLQYADNWCASVIEK